jgi:hypothetical protein
MSSCLQRSAQKEGKENSIPVQIVNLSSSSHNSTSSRHKELPIVQQRQQHDRKMPTTLVSVLFNINMANMLN